MSREQHRPLRGCRVRGHSPRCVLEPRSLYYLPPPGPPRTWFAPPLEAVGLCARPHTQTSRSLLLYGGVLAPCGDAIWSNGARRSSFVLLILSQHAWSLRLQAQVSPAQGEART